MPKIIDALPKSTRGRAKKYDFEALYKQLAETGKAAELTQGEDFTCSGASMRQFLYRDAPDFGYKAKVKTREDEDGRHIVMFTATPLSENGKPKANQEDKPKVAKQPTPKQP